MAKVLVIAQIENEKLTLGTLSTIQAAFRLSCSCDLFIAHAQPLSVTVMGIEKIWLAQHAQFQHVVAEDVAPLIKGLSLQYTHILAPATTFGKNLLPRLAALLGVAQISDVIEIIDENTFIRPIYAGNALEKIQVQAEIKLLTIRITAFLPVAEKGGTPSVVPYPHPIAVTSKTHFLEKKERMSTRPDLASAKIVVAGGRGLKSRENFKLIEQLADKLGGAVGATRAAVDAGFVDNNLQVGQTGKTVAPALYIAIGISGAVQHLAGMKESKVIVAINQDPDAPIFQIATYGLVGDLFELVPQLIEQLKH